VNINNGKALQSAAKNNHLKTAKVWELLIFVCRWSLSQISHVLLQMLVERGADVNSKSTFVSFDDRLRWNWSFR
jgi:hypothetical protein